MTGWRWTTPSILPASSQTNRSTAKSWSPSRTTCAERGPSATSGAVQATWGVIFTSGEWTVRGVDLSPRMVEEARRRSPSIDFEVGDLFALRASDATFAGIVAFYSIVHIAPEALPLAFREMHRVLRPGGRLLLAFHVGNDVLHPDDLWGIPVSLDWIFFPIDAVLSALQVAGFTVDGVVEREPYEGVEHASRRAYVKATRPLAPPLVP
jgi:SAM-dependent methyltransferase